MNIAIDEHQLGTTAILTLTGRLTIEGSAGAVQDAVRKAISDGRKEIFIDLHRVSYMDSAGLGELISSYTGALRQGATLKVQNPSPRVFELLRLTKLRDVLLA